MKNFKIFCFLLLGLFFLFIINLNLAESVGGSPIRVMVSASSGDAVIVESPSCSDSDGGRNHFVKGSVTLGSDSETDYCDGLNLVEFYCDGTEIKSEDYTCSAPYSCADGACELCPGDVFLSKLFGGSFSDYFKEIRADNDYVYAVGYTMSEGQWEEGLIAKFDKSDLSFVDGKLYGGSAYDVFYGVYVDDSFVYAVGDTRSEGQGNYAALIVKFDKSDLSLVSRKVYDGDASDHFISVYVDGGYVYATGRTDSDGQGSSDGLIVKFDKSDLSVVDGKLYGGSAYDSFGRVYADSDYVYVVGSTSSEGQGAGDGLIVKFDKSDLSLVSRKVYGGAMSDSFGPAYVDSNYVYVGGTTFSEGVDANTALIVKFDKSDLSVVSRKIFSGRSWIFTSLYGDNGYVYGVGGSIFEPEVIAGSFVVKLDKSDLSMVSSKDYGGDTWDIFSSVYVDAGYVYAVGWTYSEGQDGSPDALVVKFNAALPSGTYSSTPIGFTLQDNGLSLANSGLISADSALTLADSGLSLADSGLTLNDSNLTTATYKNCSVLCVDSDGGRHYYLKGTATGFPLGGGPGGETVMDYTDVCDLQTGELVEYYCDPASDQVTMENYVCPNGCLDGACVYCVDEGEIGFYSFDDVFLSKVHGENEADYFGDYGTTLGSGEGDFCCDGLVSVPNLVPENGGCVGPNDGSFVCTNCGDSECGLGENKCNCPEDCIDCSEHSIYIKRIIKTKKRGLAVVYSHKNVGNNVNVELITRTFDDDRATSSLKMCPILRSTCSENRCRIYTSCRYPSPKPNTVYKVRVRDKDCPRVYNTKIIRT